MMSQPPAMPIGPAFLPYELQCACGADGDADGIQPGIEAVFALIAFDGFPFAIMSIGTRIKL